VRDVTWSDALQVHAQYALSVELPIVGADFDFTGNRIRRDIFLFASILMIFTPLDASQR
jgi:hypothetical protein